MLDPLSAQLKSILNPSLCSEDVHRHFLDRLDQGHLTRAENRLSHACVYFAAFDPAAGLVFLGHHRKSGLWLFTGGHLDPGETLQEAVSREIGEEWGRAVRPESVGPPALLTITTITQPDYPCREHYDIWYFYPVRKDEFIIDQERLSQEFRLSQWMAIDEARQLVVDPNTMQALSIIEERFTTL